MPQDCICPTYRIFCSALGCPRNSEREKADEAHEREHVPHGWRVEPPHRWAK
jgi:hypothetical protein